MRVGTSSELDWQRLVIQVDARLDEGRALGELAGLLQQRTAASVPPRWLQLDPGTGARHGALAHLGVRGLDQRDAIIAQLRRMQLARGPGADWTEACLILARSDPAQVVTALGGALAEVGAARPLDDAAAWRLLTLSAQLCDVDEAAALIPELLTLLQAASSDPGLAYLATLAIVELVLALEEKFNVKIPDDQVDSIKTVGDAIAFIRSNIAAS